MTWRERWGALLDLAFKVIAVVAGVSVAATLLVALIAPAGTISIVRATLLDRLSLPSSEVFSRQDWAEIEMAETDHELVGSWVLGCYDLSSGGQLPAAKARMFRLSNSVSDYVDEGSPKTPRNEVNLKNIERRSLALSRRMGEQRITLVNRASSAYSRLQNIQWATILIGLLTTVLVSLAASDLTKNDNRMNRIIRICAIAFPALGTAVAAINSFYSPRDEWSRSARTLASVAQLHQQMALGLQGYGCQSTNAQGDADPLFRQVEGWMKRYQDIQTVSEVPASSGSGDGNQQRPPERTPDARAIPAARE